MPFAGKFAILKKRGDGVKSKYWILALSLLVLVCSALSMQLLRPKQATSVQVWSEGKLVQSLDLRVDREVTIQTERGENVLSVQGGKIAVIHADCPDGYCMQRGFCNGGAHIVCLPNRLVIKFVEETEIDGVIG